MRHFRNAGLAVLVLVSTASSAFAQRSVNSGGGGGFWEFGADFVGINFGMDDPSTTTIGLGSGSMRAGRFISDAMSIEPRVNLGIFSTTGSSANNVGVEVGLLYHLQSDHAAPLWYARPLVTFNRSSFSSGGVSSSMNRAGFGVGFGMKRPSKKNSKFIWRAEATFKNQLKSGATPSSSDLSITGGVSVLTK